MHVPLNTPSSVEQRVRIVVNLLVAQQTGRPAQLIQILGRLPDVPEADIDRALRTLADQGYLAHNGHGFVPRAPPAPRDVTDFRAQRSALPALAPTWY